MSPAAAIISGGSLAACGVSGCPIPVGLAAPGEAFHSVTQLLDPSGSRAAERSTDWAPKLSRLMNEPSGRASPSEPPAAGRERLTCVGPAAGFWSAHSNTVPCALATTPVGKTAFLGELKSSVSA